MNPHQIAFDMLIIALGTGLYALGHYHGWHDYHRKLRGSDRPPTWSSQTGLPRARALTFVTVVLVIIGLMLRWSGVLA